MHFYQREIMRTSQRIDRVEIQQQRLRKEASDTFDSQNKRISSLEKQVLALTSEKVAKGMDDSIHNSLSTLIVYDVTKVPGFNVKTEFSQPQQLTAALGTAMQDRREALVKDNPTKKYPEASSPNQLIYLKKNPDKPTSPILLRFSEPRSASFARQLLSTKGDRNVSIGRIKDAAYQDLLPFSLRLGYAMKAAGITPFYNVDPRVYDRAAKPRILPQLQILFKGQRTVLKCVAPRSDDESKQLVANAIRVQLNLDLAAVDSIVTHLSQLPSRTAPSGTDAQTSGTAQPRVPQPGGQKRNNSHLTPPDGRSAARSDQQGN